jgi:hypothetical protein
MRKIMLAVSALAAVVAGGALSGVRAAPLGNPAALAGAAEETGIIESVHCRPGWRHHYPREWRRADGCRRGGDVVVVPGRTRFIYRDGVRVRVGRDRDRDFRSRTTIRSRETTRFGRDREDRIGRDREERSGRDSETRSRSTIRSGSEGGTRSSTTTRSGRDGGGTTGGNTGARQGGGGGGGSATQQSPSGSGGGRSGGGGGGQGSSPEGRQ